MAKLPAPFEEDNTHKPAEKPSVMLELARRSNVNIDLAKCISAFFGGIGVLLVVGWELLRP